MARFQNRRHAGRLPVQEIIHYANRPDVIVFALPRGEFAVAYEVAGTLNVPLDIFIVRKRGLPG
jgi:putative phosphoribosyl transferase